MRPPPVKKALARSRHLSQEQVARTVALTLYTKLASHLPSVEYSVTERDIERWFGPIAPTLYHPRFGYETGPLFANAEDKVAFDPTPFRNDPRLRWEAERDQDLARIATSLRVSGPRGSESALLEARVKHFKETPPPNAMEAALRCIAWLETTRFFVPAGVLPGPVLKQLASGLVRMGHFIERRLYEVPLGGNHYLTHAAGLFYLGRLLPGTPATDRWARRGYAVLSHEILQQFRADGGNYEQSSGYHLFSLEVVLGATLLLTGQGEEWSAQISERIARAAHFAAALARPDGSVPLLGDDDSGRLHRWGPDPTVLEICAVAALLFNDAALARTASGASTAASWLVGRQPSQRLATLSNRSLGAKSQSFDSTGLHVLIDDSNCHVSVWSRNPCPPSMVGHAHADHNSVDAWILGKHVLRDPGTGIYLGQTELRNQLRRTAAHSTVTVDRCEVNDFDPTDTFFMPPVTRGHRCSWLRDSVCSAVTTTHDGFRRLAGQPRHVRTAYLDRIARKLMFVDEVTEGGTIARSRLVEAWWHWGNEPVAGETDVSDGIFQSRFSVDGIEIRVYLTPSSQFILTEPFPWSPRYGVVLNGWRSIIRYEGVLPFRMVLEVRY